MKHSIKALLAIFLVLTTFVNFSCKDKCENSICANGGTCYNGNCTCPTGYEGPKCDIISRNKFLGNWMQQNLPLSNIVYPPVTIAATDGITNVIINNFDDYQLPGLRGYVTHSDSLIIPLQKLPGITIEGYCFYVASNNIMVHFSITDSANNVTTTTNTKWK